MRPDAVKKAVLPRIALFSDVDGTLLSASDHLALKPRDVDRFAHAAELILASSRTLVELAPVQQRLGITAPLIAENGAVIFFPAGWRGTSSRRMTRALGQKASIIRARVRRCARAAGVTVVDQRDLLPDRGRSLRRHYSVCIRNWTGPGAKRFLAALRRDKLEATRSGTWITITSGAHKGTAVRAVLAEARRRGRPFRWSVSIGNAANDRPLLASTPGRFAIRNPRAGHHAELLQLRGVRPLAASGQRAWRELMSSILSNGQP